MAEAQKSPQPDEPQGPDQTNRKDPPPLRLVDSAVDSALDQAEETIQQMREQAHTNIGRASEAYKDASENVRQAQGMAMGRIDQGMLATAERLETAADYIRRGQAEHPSEGGLKMAEDLEIAAHYLREHDSAAVANDLRSFIKEHRARIAAIGAITAVVLVILARIRR
jgi:hypothetical protein